MSVFMKHVQALGVIAKGLELLAPLDKNQRRQVVMGMLLGSLDGDDPDDRKILEMFDKMPRKGPPP